MYKATINLEAKELELLEDITPYRQDDNKEDLTDETFIKNIFKMGLVSVTRFYAANHQNMEMIQKAHNYMLSEMMGHEFTYQDLMDIWRDDTPNS